MTSSVALDATSEQISLHARQTFKILHADKNPDAPLYVEPIVSKFRKAKNSLQTPQLLKLKKYCGIDGVRGTQRNLKACMDCDTFLSPMHDTHS